MTQPSNLVVFLARAGVGSRRACDELIKQGVVSINGEVVTFPREKVAPEDVVAVNGDPVTVRELRYLLVNKPRGVASTRRDPHAEQGQQPGLVFFHEGQRNLTEPGSDCAAACRSQGLRP